MYMSFTVWPWSQASRWLMGTLTAHCNTDTECPTARDLLQSWWKQSMKWCLFWSEGRTLPMVNRARNPVTTAPHHTTSTYGTNTMPSHQPQPRNNGSQVISYSYVAPRHTLGVCRHRTQKALCSPLVLPDTKPSTATLLTRCSGREVVMRDMPSIWLLTSQPQTQSLRTWVRDKKLSRNVHQWMIKLESLLHLPPLKYMYQEKD